MGIVFRHTDSNGTRSFDASLIVFDYDGTTFFKKQEFVLLSLAGSFSVFPLSLDSLGVLRHSQEMQGTQEDRNRGIEQR